MQSLLCKGIENLIFENTITFSEIRHITLIFPYFAITTQHFTDNVNTN